MWFRRKLLLSDVWGGYFFHKSFSHLFQGECVHTHLLHGCWVQRWPAGLGQLCELVQRLRRHENQLAVLGFKKISLTESEWTNSGLKPAGIVRYKGLKGFLMWLSSVQKIGLLVWALLSSHWSLFCIVLSTRETRGWSLFPWITWQDLALLLLHKIWGFYCEEGIDFCQHSQCWVIAEEYQVVIILWTPYVARFVRETYYGMGYTTSYYFPV